MTPKKTPPPGWLPPETPLSPEDERLLSEIRRLYGELHRRMGERWKRSLPLDDLFSDRWERARLLGFGEGTSIYASSHVYGSVRVGKQTWIGPFTVLDGSGGGIEIGDFCSVSAGVQIYTHDTVRWALTRGKAPYEQAPVRIGSGCYLGPHAIVAKGVTLGDRVVVGSGSLVTESVPSNTMVAGAPARVVRRIVVAPDGSVEFTSP